MELKSARQKISDNTKCHCFIAFHNCTPNQITPYWIDFDGELVRYPTFGSGNTLHMNTFSNHLWIFKEEFDDNSENVNIVNKNNHKVIAIPQELTDVKYLNDLCMSSIIKNVTLENNGDKNSICPLCRYLIIEKRKFKNIETFLCPHLKGEAKFFVTETDICKYWPNYHPSYVYCCNDITHTKSHTERRRNIFLVRTVHSLRELCFDKLNNIPKYSQKNIPKSLQSEYNQFVKTLKRIK